MIPDKRRAPPGGSGTLQKVIALCSCDRPEDSPLAPRDQARRRASFARATVFEMFGYRSARALDYGTFADRMPGRATSRTWWRAGP